MEKQPQDPNEDRFDEARLQAVIDAVTAELVRAGLLKTASGIDQPDSSTEPKSVVHVPDQSRQGQGLVIDLPDPASEENRRQVGIEQPADPDGLEALVTSTTARIGVGRAGARYRTAAWLLFQSDHAVTQDALMREVDAALLEKLGLFSVQTRVSEGKQEYLLRPDLGRQLSAEAAEILRTRCLKKPTIQICAGDGLSAAAIEANLEKILPVMLSGFQSAGLTVGTPFFIRFCRVGVMNDIGDLLQPDVLILLIGERPGLGRAESMSAYMAYRPQHVHSDADRDVICNIYDAGGTNPLEAGAFVVQMAQKMLASQASGIRLRLSDSGKEGK